MAVQQKIDVRDLRDYIFRLVEGQAPIAITKHGEIVGYYIPTRAKPTHDDLENLKTATDKMQEILKEAGVTENELVNDFKELRMADKSKT